MAYEILKSIVEAEAQAVELKQQATKEVEQMKKEAEKEREELLLQTRQKGKEWMQAAVDSAAQQSHGETQKIQEETMNACLKMKEKAQEKKEEAVEAVIRKVVGVYGNR